MTAHESHLFPKITDRGLDQLRARIGQPIEDSLEPWCHEATRDMELVFHVAGIKGSVEVFDNRNSRHMEKRVGTVNAPNAAATALRARRSQATGRARTRATASLHTRPGSTSRGRSRRTRRATCSSPTRRTAESGRSTIRRSRSAPWRATASATSGETAGRRRRRSSTGRVGSR